MSRECSDCGNTLTHKTYAYDFGWCSACWDKKWEARVKANREAAAAPKDPLTEEEYYKLKALRYDREYFEAEMGNWKAQ